MAVDAHHVQARQAGGALVDAHSVLVGHTELVTLEPGGYVGVCLGIHVGVDADADRGLLAGGHCHGAEHVEFSVAFHVEAADAGVERLLHLSAGLTYAGKNDLGGISACGQHALQLTTRDDVETAAGTGKHLQHGQR